MRDFLRGHDSRTGNDNAQENSYADINVIAAAFPRFYGYCSSGDSCPLNLKTPCKRTIFQVSTGAAICVRTVVARAKNLGAGNGQVFLYVRY